MLTVITRFGPDWEEYILPVVAGYYGIADEIMWAVDRDFISYSGNPFPFNLTAFYDHAQLLDPDHKIRIVREDFHSHPLGNAHANDTWEATYLAGLTRPESWLAFIDPDEVLEDSAALRACVDGWPDGLDVRVQAHQVYKCIGDKLLVVEHAVYPHPFATMSRQFELTRNTGRPGAVAPRGLVWHYTMARNPDALRRKLANWLHSGDGGPDGWARFIERWEALTLDNFRDYTDPWVHTGTWRGLKVMDAPAHLHARTN